MAPKISRNVPNFPWNSLPNLPDSQSETSKWWAETDRLTKRRFDATKPLQPDHHRDQPDSFFEGLFNEDVLRETVDARRTVCNNEYHLSILATEFLTEDDFEDKWIALGEKSQEEYILNALKKQQGGSGRMSLGVTGPEILNCPELCRDELMRDSGKGFVDLLKKFLRDNNDEVPTQPFILENEMFNRFIGWKKDEKFLAKKGWLEMRRLMRTHNIAAFIGLVLAAYKGHDVKLVSRTHEHGKTKKVLREMIPVVDSILGPAAGKEWRKAEAVHRKEMKLYCDNCLKPEDKAENGKMSVCVRCKAIGKEVRYCNKECQRSAWKDHKRECGKALDLSSISQPVSAVNRRGNRSLALRPDIPPADPDFRRSAHLLRLIKYLNEFPKKDYIIFPPCPDPRDPIIEGVSLDEVHGASVFIVMRNRAMCAGDPGALMYVYRVLQKYCRTAEDGVSLRRQMKDEYGAVWARVYDGLRTGDRPEVRKVSKEEVEEALVSLKTSGRFNELNDYEPAEGKVQHLGLQVGPEKDVTAIVDFPELSTYAICNLVPCKKPPKKKPTTAKWNDSKFVLPEVTKREDYIRHPGLDVQQSFLAANPAADYILFSGPSDGPAVPHALSFGEPTTVLPFLHHRHRIFEHGGYDFDALVYVYMSLEQATRRKKVSKEALIMQLVGEYGEEYMAWVLDCVDGDIYRRRDGKVLESKDAIGFRKDEMSRVFPMLEDRFPMFKAAAAAKEVKR